MDNDFSRRLNETIVRRTLPSGLSVTVLPKAGFHKTEAHLAVGFGSIDEDEAAVTEGAFPPGTAHFLEHMLFEHAEADPTAAFARVGAQVNAYTAADVTDYYCSTTEPWKPALDLLFGLVLRPDIPAAGIEKEREIIGREIQMYEDDVNDLIYEDLLNALYREHPVRHPIAGTVASIAAIDRGVLAAAHAVFYVPANMHLVVVGDVDPEEIFAAATVHPALSAGTAKPMRRPRPEDHVPAKTRVDRRKDIKNDMLMLGVKLDRPADRTPFANDLDEIAWSFVFDQLLGKASPSVQDLFRRGLANESLEASAQCEPDYGHLVVYTETKKPEAAAKALWSLFDRAGELLDPVRFETAKRRLVGNYIQAFNSISALAGFVLDYALEDVDVFDLIAAIDGLGIDDVRRILPQLRKDARVTVTYRRDAAPKRP